MKTDESAKMARNNIYGDTMSQWKTTNFCTIRNVQEN